jgi:hypothetical protein
MQTFRLKPQYPTEHQEQVGLMRWVALRKSMLPELRNLIAIPNGSKRDVGTGVKLVREGLSAGFPDLFLFVPRPPFHGLAIELKRRVNGVVTPKQKEWHERLRSAGYRCEVAYGASEAIRVIEEYLNGW